MRSILIFALLFNFLCLTDAFTQIEADENKEIDIDQFIQEIFAIQDQDANINYEDIYEALFQLYTSPINLNEAGRDELNSLFILSEQQVSSFLRYRRDYGNLYSVYELASVPFFDEITIKRMLPFVTLEKVTKEEKKKPLLRRILTERNNYLLLRGFQTLQEKKGFTAADTTSQGDPETRYLGSPQQLYARFRVSNPGDFSLGFTVEKDPGEELTWDPETKRYGMDFFSAHFMLQNQGRLKNLMVGDYQIQVGQGLLLSAGFNIGKGSETVYTVRRSTLGIRPYSSVLESGFFRGGAFTYQLMDNNRGVIDVTAFYSNMHQDANIQESEVVNNENIDVDVAIDTDIVENFVSSIQNTGLHRTASEIQAKNKFNEQVAGSHLSFSNKNRNFQVGATFVYTQYDINLQRTDQPYNAFEFSGKTNYNYGINYSYHFHNLHFFGEAARSKSGGIGVNTGLVASLTPTFEMGILYRYYAKDFHTFYGSAFGEGTRNINEQGFYWGIKYNPLPGLFIAAYYDKFKFPWLRYRIEAPSEGYEYLARVSYQLNRNTSVYGQYREEIKEENDPDNEERIDILTQRRRRNYALGLSYQPNGIISSQTKIQWSDYHISETLTSGYALIQDFNFDFGRFAVSTRIALFDTDDYNNRQYVYEKDVLYAFSIPAYQYRGVRNYILLRYKLNNKITFWAKYGRTKLVNRDHTGSGLDEIDGNVRSEVRLQAKIRF